MRGSDLFAEDVPLLNTPNLVALVLRAAEVGAASAELCADRLEALFRKTGEDPPVGRDELVGRCGKTVGWLRAAGLLEADDRAWKLSARGREALAEHPRGMDLADLAGYPEFADYLDAETVAARRTGARAPSETAYDQGFAARHAGVAFTENPHGFGTADHQKWETGWCEALDGEEVAGPSPLTGGSREAS